MANFRTAAGLAILALFCLSSFHGAHASELTDMVNAAAPPKTEGTAPATVAKKTPIIVLTPPAKDPFAFAKKTIPPIKVPAKTFPKPTPPLVISTTGDKKH
ncbi:hypothetical protein ACKKBG_A07605 [Auxenochlorella protothecoides x Auxenochlorella symbiontica]